MSRRKKALLSASRSDVRQLGLLSYSIWPNKVRPSTAIDAVMEGAERLEDQSKAMQSVISFYIYLEAKKVMAGKNKEQRKKLLDKQPELVRPHIEREVKRLWNRDK